MANRNLKGDVNVQFEEPTSRINLDSGSSIKTLFGRISKWLKDLKAVAFSGSYTDLSDKPTIPPATAVKGNSETTYRTGNVNLTPANIGAVNKSGDTMTGALTHNGAGTVLKSTNLDANGDNPTSNTWSNTPIEYHDKDDTRIGFVNVQRRTDGSTMLEIGAQARNTADTADIYNVIDMLIGRDGTRSYAVTDHAAFRTAISAASKDQVNYNTNNGVKNLLKVDIPEKTVVGLTFTPQSDGTIIVNGTSTATQTYVVYFNLENPSKTTTNTQHSENKIGYGDFTISLNGEEAYTPGIYLQILCYDSITTNPKVTAQVAYGESKSVMIDTDKKYVWFRLLFDKSINGKVFNNFVCKPMIRDATIEDSTFEPYAKSNAELTADIPLTIHIDYSNIDAHTCDSTYNECLSALESGRAVIAMIQITSKLMRTCFFGLDTDTKIICGEIPNGSTTYDFDWRAGEDCPSIGISS